MIIQHNTSIEVTNPKELEKVYKLLNSQGFTELGEMTIRGVTDNFNVNCKSEYQSFFITYKDNKFLLCNHEGCETTTHLKASDL